MREMLSAQAPKGEMVVCPRTESTAREFPWHHVDALNGPLHTHTHTLNEIIYIYIYTHMQTSMYAHRHPQLPNIKCEGYLLSFL